MHSGKNDKKFGQGPPPPWFGNNPKEQQLFFEMSSLTVDRKVFSSTKPLQFEVRRRWSTYGPLITPFSHDLKNWRTFHNQAFVEKSIVLCCCGTCSLITITLNEVNIALSCKKHTCLVKNASVWNSPLNRTSLKWLDKSTHVWEKPLSICIFYEVAKTKHVWLLSNTYQIQMCVEKTTHVC